MSQPLLNKRTQKPFRQCAASPSWLEAKDEWLVGEHGIRGKNFYAPFAKQFDEGHDRTGGATCEGDAERLLGKSPSPFGRALLAWGLIAVSIALALVAVIWFIP